MRTEFKNTLPDYAKDLTLNLSTVLIPGNTLTTEQVAGIALASSYATHNQVITHELLASLESTLTDSIIYAAKAAASLMAMNNIYYRFIHLCENKEYSTLPAGLRMNIMANPGVDKIEFELYALAVSAINGCGLCLSSHSKTLEKAGVSKQAIQHAIKIASVINGVAQVLAIERSR